MCAAVLCFDAGPSVRNKNYQYYYKRFSSRLSLWVPKLVKVYCEMELSGGGYAFIHPMYLNVIADADVQAMFTDRTSFLMRVRMTNGIQKYGALQQLPQYSRVEHKSV